MAYEGVTDKLRREIAEGKEPFGAQASVKRVTSEELDRIIKESGKPYMASGGNIAPYVSPLYEVDGKFYYTYDDLHPTPTNTVNGEPATTAEMVEYLKSQKAPFDFDNADGWTIRNIHVDNFNKVVEGVVPTRPSITPEQIAKMVHSTLAGDFEALAARINAHFNGGK